MSRLLNFAVGVAVTGVGLVKCVKRASSTFIVAVCALHSPRESRTPYVLASQIANVVVERISVDYSLSLSFLRRLNDLFLTMDDRRQERKELDDLNRRAAIVRYFS